MYGGSADHTYNDAAPHRRETWPPEGKSISSFDSGWSSARHQHGCARVCLTEGDSHVGAICVEMVRRAWQISKLYRSKQNGSTRFWYP